MQYAKITFRKMVWCVSCLCFYISVINKGWKVPDLAKKMESSENDKETIGVCPQALIRHFKQIINRKNQEIPNEITKQLKKVAYLLPDRPLGVSKNGTSENSGYWLLSEGLWQP